MTNYLFDSNIIIDYARGHRPTIDFLYDALIAATAMTRDLTLVTRNAKHFQNILDLKLLAP